MSQKPLKESVQRVQAAIEAKGFEFEIKTFPAGTRTAQDAAAAIGCSVGQIAKSLIFRGRESDRPVLVIASGPNRVDESKVADLIGEAIGRADADFVRQRTGFAIGGVPPVGHKEPPLVLIDQDLLDHAVIWAAAGTPASVFALAPTALPELAGGKLADIKAP